MLPMNAMAQKVVPGSESGSMKPLTGSGLSYVTLQPPSQPLSLVQDHRPSVYQTPPYIGSNMEKEPETEKLIPNGVEITATKTTETPEQGVPAPVVKQSETNRNNNLSPENPAPEQPCEMQPEQELTSMTLDFPALCTQAQTKVEEKKAPVNNGSKESDGKAINTTPVHIKQSPHKPEDTSAKSEVPKTKPTNQSSKVPSDNAAAALTTTCKPDAKITTTTSKTTKRKSRELKDLKAGGSSAVADGASKPKRNRVQTQPYQSPLPEIALLVKSFKSSPSKSADDKLIVFYKNEFLAVRNAEGSFYVCQAMQNIYKSSRRIRIRWLSQDKNDGEFYSPDFYDNIEFDCILTNLNLNKVDKHKFCLTRIELLRTENILKRAIDVEAGVSEKPRVTEEHPDGLDVSLYKDEAQLKRRKGLHEKTGQRKKSKRTTSSTDEDADEEESEKRTPKMSRAKKRSVNKALAIAKSVAKGTSRAERALNRSTKSDSSLGNDVATSAPIPAAAAAAAAAATITATATAVATTAIAGATTAAAAAAATATATAGAAAGTMTTVASTASTAANPAMVDTKNNAETKKLDLKKNGKQPNSNSVRGIPRTKLGGSTQATQANKAAGRPKRVAAAAAVAVAGVPSTEEAPSPRKKPRGRT